MDQAFREVGLQNAEKAYDVVQRKEVNQYIRLQRKEVNQYIRLQRKEWVSRWRQECA